MVLGLGVLVGIGAPAARGAGSDPLRIVGPGREAHPPDWGVRTDAQHQWRDPRPQLSPPRGHDRVARRGGPRHPSGRGEQGGRGGRRGGACRAAGGAAPGGSGARRGGPRGRRRDRWARAHRPCRRVHPRPRLPAVQPGIPGGAPGLARACDPASSRRGSTSSATGSRTRWPIHGGTLAACRPRRGHCAHSGPLADSVRSGRMRPGWALRCIHVARLREQPEQSIGEALRSAGVDDAAFDCLVRPFLSGRPRGFSPRDPRVVSPTRSCAPSWPGLPGCPMAGWTSCRDDWPQGSRS